MTMLSTDAAARREAARHQTGEFGHQARTSPVAVDDESGDAYGCPACGEPSDYCQGHGPIGDPNGSDILDRHDNGDHTRCRPSGCDVADARDQELNDDRFVLNQIRENADRYGDTPTWGKSTGPFGWGDVNAAEEVAPGVLRLDCSGHGGYKLSGVRNNDIPPALRNRNGWYEEDAESHIVAAYCPDVFADGQTRTIAEVQASGVAGMKNWFPEKYEAATGETIPLDESYLKRDAALRADRAAYRDAHRDEFVGIQRTETPGSSSWVPDGYAAVTARRDDTGEERVYLVPYNEAVKDHRILDNVLIDPSRHMDVTAVSTLGAPPKRPAPTPVADLGVNLSGLTAAQRSRADDELNRRYRWDDGFVGSRAQRFVRDGATGKSVAIYSGDKSATYAVDFTDADGNTRIHKVSKAAWDAMTGLPDTTTDSERASMDVHRAVAKVDRLRDQQWGAYSRGDRDGHGRKMALAEADVALARNRRDRAQKAENAAAGILPFEERLAIQRAAIGSLLNDNDSTN